MQETPDIKKLIELYENEINSSPTGVLLRIGHSEARKELVRIGRDALPDIFAHLEATGFCKKKPEEPQATTNLAHAWVTVLKGVSVVHRIPDAPDLDSDRAGWLAWAQSHVPAPRPVPAPLAAAA
jgi:hypothetical protein